MIERIILLLLTGVALALAVSLIWFVKHGVKRKTKTYKYLKALSDYLEESIYTKAKEK